MAKAYYVNRLNPCPVCGKDHGCQILSDVAVLCLRTDKNNVPSGWVWKKELTGGMGSLVVAVTSQTEQERQQQREQWQQQREERKKQDRQRKATALTDEQRDKEARKLLKQLGLSTRHRQSLLNRGLTDADIEAIGFKSVTRYQHLMIPVNPNFPGISIDGLTLQIKNDGFLIPLFSFKGLIIGFQLASDNREDGKYKHLVRPHLKNGELPLQFYQTSSRNLDLIEGTLKPLIASRRHHLTVVGAGGVNWHHSPEQFQAILEEIQPERIVLNPDAGSLLNPQVLRQYRELNQFIKRLGYTLEIRDWGQGKQLKSQGLDIDEIDIDTFNQATLISFENWAGITEAGDSHSLTLSQTEWFEQFKLPQLQQELTQTLKQFYSHHLRKGKKLDQTTEFAASSIPKTTSIPTLQSTAIVLWKPQLLTSMPYIPGQLPIVEEWQQLGHPQFIIQQGERLTFYQEAYEKGYKYLKDSTPAGHGKSHDAGLINLETFGIDPDQTENKTRIFYLSPDHRNPTNATIEGNYIDLESRHNGLVYDFSRRTPLGKPYIIRATSLDQKNGTITIPSNCPENDTFLTVSELGLPVFGGKDSPICQSCPLLSQGCPFLLNRRETLSYEPLIRADINSIPTPSKDDILIVEESDKNIKNAHQITIKVDEIIKTASKLQLRDDERIFKALRPLLMAVYQALEEVDQEKYKWGIYHHQVMELMPSIDELNQKIWELYADDWLKADNVWGTPIWDYEMINGEVTAIKISGTNWIAPSLKDLKKECYKIFENYEKYLNSLDTPQQKQAAIKANIIPSWLPILIDCVTGNKRINLRINNGKLMITKLAKRHRNIIKNAGFSIALDATQSKEDYAFSLGINPNEILEVREVQRCTPNLHIHLIKGLGNCGKQRRDTQQQRIRIGIEAIAKIHKEQGHNIGLIDHKSAIEHYQDLVDDLKLGYWHRDTRGSNQFLNTQSLISIGRPVPNLGGIGAEYQILGGWVNCPEKLIGQYGQWVNRKITSELIQDVSRLRAHLRPNEQLHSYLVADFDQHTISQIRLAFPGATVTVEKIDDYAPEAASKGAQTERGIIEALWHSIQSGTVATIDEIATKLGITKSGITNNLKDRLGIGFRLLKKSLLLLLESINSKSQLSDLPDDARWIAETYLPLVVQSLESGEITPSDVVVEVVTWAQSYGRRTFRRILAMASVPTLCKLLGAVMCLLPNAIKTEIQNYLYSHSFIETRLGESIT